MLLNSITVFCVYIYTKLERSLEPLGKKEDSGSPNEQEYKLQCFNGAPPEGCNLTELSFQINSAGERLAYVVEA